jgi:hypothetical protein
MSGLSGDFVNTLQSNAQNAFMRSIVLDIFPFLWYNPSLPVSRGKKRGGTGKKARYSGQHEGKKRVLRNLRKYDYKI